MSQEILRGGGLPDFQWKGKTMEKHNNEAEQIIYRMNCDEEEKIRKELDRMEKEKFLNGLKRYPELGIPVYIDDKEAGPDDWEKLTAVREDNRFYMGDFVQNEVTGKLKEIRFDMVYHGEIRETPERERRRGRRKREYSE